MHIAFVTAGGAGMFCGSCMQDNALAKALIRCGAEVSLIPTYTPIRVDDQDFTTDQVYLGGINLYLDERIPFWRWMPRSLVSWLDHPKVIKWATRYGVSNDAANLGPMTLAMLAGGNGPMAREYEQFAQHLVSDLKPDAIIFSNALLSGAMPMIRERFSGPVLCMIQGDDIFLDQLPDSFRKEAIRTIHDHSRTFSAFVTHTRFYAGMMAEYLGIAPEKFQQIPLSVDLDAIDAALGQIPKKQAASRKQIGYFARIAPEKGLLPLVTSAVRLAEHRNDFQLVAGGYLGGHQQKYFEQIQKSAQKLGDRFQYIGSPPALLEKMAFLKQNDLFSVPVQYAEPKGLYVLESLSAGVPVLQPATGSFPELLESTGGGLLFDPHSEEDYLVKMEMLLENPEQRTKLGEQGHALLRERHSTSEAAAQLLKICESAT